MSHSIGRLRRGWTGVLLTLPVVLASAVRAPVPVAAGGPTVTGAGSTWVQIALDQWRADIARQGYSINYQGVGSSAGRQFFILGQVDFAASEIPFQPDEVAQLKGKSYQYFPDVAGGTSLMYNLHTPSGSRITDLHLDADTAARIFTGAITSWQDPAIQSLNPGLQVREQTVIPVIRSDGSGTSAQFSLYLSDQAGGPWNDFVSRGGCPAPCSVWPTFPGSTQQKGSDGVANFVSNDAVGAGSIGYVEAGYAYGRGFPVASLRNASGNFVQPTSVNVSTALTHATLNPDLTQNLSGVYHAPDANAYPMSSYSYMITQTAGFDPAKGAVLGTWLLYIACAGQRQAAPLGYSPLPPNLVRAVFDAEQRLPGAPPVPPIDAAHCPNPTVTGEGAGAGAKAPPGGGSGSATGAASAASRATAAARGAASAAGTASAGVAGAAAGTADPAAIAAAAAAAGSAGSDADPSGIATLDDRQRRAALAMAARLTRDAPFGSSGPLLIAAGSILAVVFGPTLVEWARIRRRARRAGSGSPDRLLRGGCGRAS